MTWIRTIPFADATGALQELLEKQRALYPVEYKTPSVAALPPGGSIVESHTLIPDALFHAFSTFGALMSPELPLTRRQHEMIAHAVSETNRCRY